MLEAMFWMAVLAAALAAFMLLTFLVGIVIRGIRSAIIERHADPDRDGDDHNRSETKGGEHEAD